MGAGGAPDADQRGVSGIRLSAGGAREVVVRRDSHFRRRQPAAVHGDAVVVLEERPGIRSSVELLTVGRIGAHFRRERVGPAISIHRRILGHGVVSLRISAPASAVAVRYGGSATAIFDGGAIRA